MNIDDLLVDAEEVETGNRVVGFVCCYKIVVVMKILWRRK